MPLQVLGLRLRLALIVTRILRSWDIPLPRQMLRACNNKTFCTREEVYVKRINRVRRNKRTRVRNYLRDSRQLHNRSRIFRPVFIMVRRCGKSAS